MCVCMCVLASYSFNGIFTPTMSCCSVDNDGEFIPVCNGVAAYNEDNPLGDDGVRKKAQAWSIDQNISTLNLPANGIGAAGAEALGVALKASFSITSVDCSRNGALGDEGAKLLVPALRSDGTGISCIRALNLLRCGIGDDGATALAQGLRGNSVLEQVNLTGNCIGNEGVIELVGSLVGSSKGFLQDLWLSSNRVGPAGGEGIAAALARSPSLRELHLSGNALGDLGVTALVKGAVAGRGLRGLYVGGCGVTNAGAKDIANVLPNSLHLETLCLGHSAIGDDGASALARALAENHALRRLNLPGNRLMAAGGKAIAGMLLSNGSLFCLDVSNNYLGSAGIEAMANAIIKNTTLLELNVSACGGTNAAFLALARAVEANNTLGTLLYTGNHLNATTLAEMDYAMGRPKRSVRELVGQVQKSIDQRDLRCRGEELVQSTKSKGGAHPSVQLIAGQETSVQVSFGRKDNIVGSITVTNDTSLEEARVLIEPLLRDSERNAFRFITTAGSVVPPEDEPARRVVWDCGLPLRLRPANWVVIGRV